MLNWIDVETTGLDPDDGYLLEIGCIITNDKLEEQGRAAFLINSCAGIHDTLGIERMQVCCDDFVREMHTKNGLWDDLRSKPTYTLVQLVPILSEFIEKGAPLCGNSVHFDRLWLRAKMPEVEKLLHYRNIDVSTLKELYKRFVGVREKSEPKHRVLDDLEGSIAELRFYLGAMGWL